LSTVPDQDQQWTQAAADFEGGSFRISYEWKEMLTYWEDDNGFVFECAWGVDPGIVFVPPADVWDEVMPEWLVGRRGEVVDLLRRHSAHNVKDDDKRWSHPVEAWRLRRR
jgi:hypothetical protein